MKRTLKIVYYISLWLMVLFLVVREWTKQSDIDQGYRFLNDTRVLLVESNFKQDIEKLKKSSANKEKRLSWVERVIRQNTKKRAKK